MRRAFFIFGIRRLFVVYSSCISRSVGSCGDVVRAFFIRSVAAPRDGRLSRCRIVTLRAERRLVSGPIPPTTIIR